MNGVTNEGVGYILFSTNITKQINVLSKCILAYSYIHGTLNFVSILWC